MHCVTKEEFEKAAEAGSKTRYYTDTDRWEYYKLAVDMVEQFGPFEKVMEIGPAWIPVVVGCDTLDNLDERITPTYLHNIKTLPWPIKDKQYDLVIALQVWEHIYNRQIEAFGELKRVAKNAILSFPWDWQCRMGIKCINCHCGITKQTIRAWTHNIEPVKWVVHQESHHLQHKRLICFWEFGDE